MESKTCGRCGLEKPVADFSKSGYTEDGRRRHCKECVADRRLDPAKTRGDRNRTLLARFGMSLDEVEAMHERQGGRCAICGDPIEFGAVGIKHALKASRPHVDHCHRAEDEDGAIVVRGLLCGPCNSGLGHFRDDPAIMLAAVRYLAEHVDYRPVGGAPKRSKQAHRTIDEERAIVADYLASSWSVKRFANARGMRASTVYRLLKLYGEQVQERKVYASGELSPIAKLTAEIAREMFTAFHVRQEDATAIAGQYGVTRAAVVAVVERKTWRDATADLLDSTAKVRPDARRRLTGAEEAAIRAALAAGTPRAEIAAAYSISRARVSQLAKSAGCAPASRGGRPTTVSPEIEAAVLAGLAAGRTQSSLATEFGVSQPWVSRLARR